LNDRTISPGRLMNVPNARHFAGFPAFRFARIAGANLRRILAFCVLASTAGAAPPESAPDIITLQREGSVGRITLRGMVRDFTGRTLEFLPGAGGGMQSYPSSEVVSVESPQIDAHRRGVSEFGAGKIVEAAASFDGALKEEKRSWMRREILAMSIRCALYRGDRAAAGTRFLALLQSDPETKQFELIPLVWNNAPLDPAIAAQGRGWLGHSTEAGRLIGASLLLNDAQQGTAAERELRQLATSSDARILHLARAQQWRQSLKVTELPREELERWESRIEEMPERLRGGPHYLVGQGYLARGEKHRAAAAFLWLPTVYDLDAGLAAQACVDAAELLADIGQKNSAALLYRETIERFAGTAAAGRAAEMLKAAETPPNSENKT
jgi:hypothetical protein